MILKIPRIEVGVCEWGVEVQVLVPVILDELVIPVIDSARLAGPWVAWPSDSLEGLSFDSR